MKIGHTNLILINLRNLIQMHKCSKFIKICVVYVYSDEYIPLCFNIYLDVSQIFFLILLFSFVTLISNKIYYFLSTLIFITRVTISNQLLSSVFLASLGKSLESGQVSASVQEAGNHIFQGFSYVRPVDESFAT